MVIAKKCSYVLLTSQPTELAEYVLNKCITKDKDSNSTDTANQPVHYNFEHLEDNVLDCMVSQDIVRVWELPVLQHTTVQFVNEFTLLYKPRDVTIPH